jgi:hypothetical protein
VIASAGKYQRPVDRTRRLLIVAVVVLAAGTVVSTLAASHFRHQVTQLQGHRSTATYSASAVPSPSGTTPSSAAPVEGVSPPPLTSQSFDLDTGTMHTAVYLTAAASPGDGSTQGQLVVTALLRGAVPGVRYRLIGGGCDPRTPADTVWAQGTADPTGIAFLTGAARTLPKGDPYFLALDPWHPPGADPRLTPGLEGDLVLGQAEPFVGNVNRLGLGGGECVIGP